MDDQERGDTPKARPRPVTFADVKLWGKRWACRWCRAKAETIAEIEHERWCRMLAEEPTGV